MKLIKITILLFSILMAYNVTCQSTTEDLLWRVVLDEKFNDNRNNWHTDSTKLRHAQISDGELTDWNGEKGNITFNTTPIELLGG